MCDGCSHCYKLYRLYRVLGGGVRMDVVGWGFVLELAKLFWIGWKCKVLLGLSFVFLGPFLAEWGNLEIL